MTESEARAAILANGYCVVHEHPRSVTVTETKKNRRSAPPRSWTGINFLDLVQMFRLDTIKAKQDSK